LAQLPDLEAWAIFAKVAERGSFSEAARELGLAKTTISKSISRLEQRMRTTLFHRTTRKLSLTETGRLSLERALRILADGTAIEADVLEEAAVPRGLVRMAALTAFGEDALAPVLPRFLDEYPEIELDIVLTDKPVDIVAEGFDLALRIGAGVDSSLRASRLYSLRRPLTAAPALLERYGIPRHPDDIAAIPALIATHVPRPGELLFHGPEGETCLVQLRPGLRINSSRALLPALIAGVGIAAMPEVFVRRALEAGEVIELLPGWKLEDGELFVVTPPGRARPARVRVFIEFLRRQFTAGTVIEVQER
jgi:DNA-binding transcriptional LysR family regulator